MISLKRNFKGDFVKAPGMRSVLSSMYQSNQEKPFRISRSKFSDFLSCPRCFYLDRVEGLISPSTPGWSLNATTDLLLKREFDTCRVSKKAHHLLAESGLDHIIPFDHPDLDKWRNAVHGGLEHRISDSDVVLHGGIDDLWLDTVSQKIIVVEYKSQAQAIKVDPEHYFDDVYHQSYKVQLDIYVYLLVNMGFQVSETAYIYVCNANKTAADFAGKLLFEETLVPYNWDIDWVETKLKMMIRILQSPELPDANLACENCAYSRRRADIERISRKHDFIVN